jgi:hypothetical protein
MGEANGVDEVRVVSGEAAWEAEGDESPWFWGAEGVGISIVDGESP